MRLGAQVLRNFASMRDWAEFVNEKGYRAAFCPVDCHADDSTVSELYKSARDFDIVIAEVGVWNNVLHPNKAERRRAIAYAKRQLALADRLEAKCCVNIAGTLNSDVWYGPHRKNFSSEIFAAIVKTVQEIIDDVGPRKTFYTLEPSPFLPPDTIESYLELIRAVNRPAFAVHWDPVNMLWQPRHFYNSAAFFKECAAAFGDLIKSCHLKDASLDETFTLYVKECRVGAGEIDYAALLEAIDGVDPDMPGLIEHLDCEADADAAFGFVSRVMGRGGSV